MSECLTTSEPLPYTGIGGHTRYRMNCTTCDATCTGWTRLEALDAFLAHEAIPAPPADVLAAPLTPEVLSAYPEYYIDGRGRPLASSTDCGHGYWLTDSCPCCP